MKIQYNFRQILSILEQASCKIASLRYSGHDAVTDVTLYIILTRDIRMLQILSAWGNGSLWETVTPRGRGQKGSQIRTALQLWTNKHGKFNIS
jgi:hypothetical protein